jgi:hypothetical protein
VESFQEKLDTTLNQLTHWNISTFTDLNLQMTKCKSVIMFFDRIEEKISLNSAEFRLRLKIKEKVFELACNKELTWMQRTRCKWLNADDKNTRFFHAFAFARARRNVVLSIKQGQHR